MMKQAYYGRNYARQVSNVKL